MIAICFMYFTIEFDNNFIFLKKINIAKQSYVLPIYIYAVLKIKCFWMNLVPAISLVSLPAITCIKYVQS